MAPVLYRCPNTGQSVQAWVADEPDDDDLTFAQVTCFACAQAHLVNPKTGNVLGAAEDD
jgi:hypothetical protein